MNQNNTYTDILFNITSKRTHPQLTEINTIEVKLTDQYELTDYKIIIKNKEYIIKDAALTKEIIKIYKKELPFIIDVAQKQTSSSFKNILLTGNGASDYIKVKHGTLTIQLSCNTSDLMPYFRKLYENILNLVIKYCEEKTPSAKDEINSFKYDF